LPWTHPGRRPTVRSWSWRLPPRARSSAVEERLHGSRHMAVDSDEAGTVIGRRGAVLMRIDRGSDDLVHSHPERRREGPYPQRPEADPDHPGEVIRQAKGTSERRARVEPDVSVVGACGADRNDLQTVLDGEPHVPDAVPPVDAIRVVETATPLVSP